MRKAQFENDGLDLAKGMAGRGLTRRRFIQRLANAGAGAACLGALPGFPAVGASRKGGRRARKKVVILATEVRYLSHAQHFIDRFLEGYGWAGEHHYPPFELASMYIDQSRQGDLSRERSTRHGVPIYPTVAEALTLGGSKLAVDGVLIIAEHGRYPRNEKGQTLYPRYRFFKEVVKVFESSGRTVPVFNDKHLSTDWKECVEMVEDARRLGFAFLAGSSLPVTWRIPSLEMPMGTPLVASLCACYGGVDSYDFHGYETAQCMSERRAGGESGVIAVQALRGAGVWDKLAAGEESRRLLFAALARSHTVKPPPGYTLPVWSMDWFREACPSPFGCFIEHRDGFQTTMLLLNGLIQDFNYAGLTRPGEIISTQMYLPMPPRNTTLPNFFNPLVNNIERTILERRAVYPLERTLLTSGMTLFGVESLHRGQARIETPEMNVAYRAARESTYWSS